MVHFVHHVTKCVPILFNSTSDYGIELE